jgi:hypothetical protein
VAGHNNWGGVRPGGGRPKGSRSNPMGRVKPSKEACEAVLEAAQAELLSGKETALDIMERVMRGDIDYDRAVPGREGVGALPLPETVRDCSAAGSAQRAAD